jgi:hypothetical protein
MKDPADNKTPELIEKPKTKAQRFKEKQNALGLKQYSFWLNPGEAAAVKGFIKAYIKGMKD